MEKSLFIFHGVNLSFIESFAKFHNSNCWNTEVMIKNNKELKCSQWGWKLSDIFENVLFHRLWITWKSHFFNLILAMSNASSMLASRSSLLMSSGRPTNSTHSVRQYYSCSANLFSISTALSINLSLLFLPLLMLLM